MRWRAAAVSVAAVAGCGTPAVPVEFDAAPPPDAMYGARELQLTSGLPVTALGPESVVGDLPSPIEAAELCESFEMSAVVAFDPSTGDPVSFGLVADFIPLSPVSPSPGLTGPAEDHFRKWLGPRFGLVFEQSLIGAGYVNESLNLGYGQFIVGYTDGPPWYTGFYDTATRGPRFGAVHGLGSELVDFPSMSDASMLGPYDGPPVWSIVIEDIANNCVPTADLVDRVMGLELVRDVSACGALFAVAMGVPDTDASYAGARFCSLDPAISVVVLFSARGSDWASLECPRPSDAVFEYGCHTQ